jgi:acyl dehydratase
MRTMYFEDFRVGEQTTSGPHVVTKEEIVAFARQWDPQPFHVDEVAAGASAFGGLTASGCHVISITVSLIMRRDVRVAVLAALGWDEVRFLAPVRPGDDISIVHECLEARASQSKPDRGVVKNRITAVTADAKPVLSYVDTILVAKRP